MRLVCAQQKQTLLHRRSDYSRIHVERLTRNSEVRYSTCCYGAQHCRVNRGMGVNVAMAVEMRRRETRARHPVDLCKALTLDVRFVNHAQRCGSKQSGQRVELATSTVSQRGFATHRVAHSEVEMKPY